MMEEVVEGVLQEKLHAELHSLQFQQLGNPLWAVYPHQGGHHLDSLEPEQAAPIQYYKLRHSSKYAYLVDKTAVFVLHMS